MTSKKRLAWFIVVLVFSLIFIEIKSTYIYLTNQDFIFPNNLNLRFALSSVWSLLSIILLYFVLKKQNRNFREIGFSFKASDIVQAILLFVAVYLVLVIAVLLAPQFMTEPENINFLQTDVSIFYFLYILINPFFEELIVRAYTTSEILHFTKNEEISVLISVAIQTSYHLYQGLIPALYNGITFLVFSVYYVKTKRIVPVILVHLLFDILAMLKYGIL